MLNWGISFKLAFPVEKMRFYALWLCAVCVVVFLVQLFVSGFTDALLLDSSSFVQPWRFITSIFLHGDIAHLLYNLFALGLFGSMLERLLGGKRFLFIFFATGVGANLLSVFFYDASLGASGAIFGVIGALIVIRPGLPVFVFGLPMPIFIAGIVWAVGDIIGIFVPSGVANLAHLGGMALGLLMGVFYRKPKEEQTKLKIDEGLMNSWEDNYMK